ncbi:MAG: hypothetical protein GF329_00420 [Candidatus Lokiarchaeota archaeon]|nr:hypothetical protein [Candidatus Lokiarchaeota archaeon]
MSKDSKDTMKNELETRILIIRIIVGLLFGIIGFFLYETFNYHFIIAILVWLISGFAIPLILITIIYKNELKLLGSTFKIIFYGVITSLLVYVITYGVLFLITAYI